VAVCSGLLELEVTAAVLVYRGEKQLCRLHHFQSTASREAQEEQTVLAISGCGHILRTRFLPVREKFLRLLAAFWVYQYLVEVITVRHGAA
jgi:hypothetical protein